MTRHVPLGPCCLFEGEIAYLCLSFDVFGSVGCFKERNGQDIKLKAEVIGMADGGRELMHKLTCDQRKPGL
jgi:hypothetical protein